MTSSYVNDSIPCTFQDGLTIQDIGAISTHASYIIGVHSGPFMACYNQQTKNHVKHWFVFQDQGIQHRGISVTDHARIEQVTQFFNNI